MKVNAMGLEVRVQPKSLVMHLEGRSYGTDLNEGGKHNQVLNHQKFIDRWTETLATHRPNAEAPEQEKERRAGSRVLVIDARMLMPDKDSGSLRMSNLVKSWAANHKVTFVPKNLASQEPYDSALEFAGVEVITAPYVLSIDEFLEQRGAEFETVVLSRLEVADELMDVVKERCPDAQVIYDTVDLHFLREQREMELLGKTTLPREAEETKQAELRAMDRADVTWVVSTLEVDLLADECPDVDVRLVSNVHVEKLSLIHISEPTRPY